MALNPQGMANEMEHQLQALWSAEYGHELTDVGRRQRELLFLAIARGVLKYLRDQEHGGEHLLSEMRFSYDGWTWTGSVENLVWNIEIPDID